VLLVEWALTTNYFDGAVKKTQEVIVSHGQNVTVDVPTGSKCPVDVVNLDVTSRQRIIPPLRNRPYVTGANGGVYVVNGQTYMYVVPPCQLFRDIPLYLFYFVSK
jgi:hypothetical protein